MGVARDDEDFRPGDKLRVRKGPFAGQRGLVSDVDRDQITLSLVSGESVALPASQLTNFSRAARRAWMVMPKRAGRPRSDAPRKVMVSMRLDPSVRGRLSLASELGLIRTREEAVNQWLRERLDQLFAANPGIGPTEPMNDLEFLPALSGSNHG